MPIYFRFRSAAAFDCVSLHGRPYLSVSELRAKIIQKKKLQICRLIISNPFTGEILDDDDILIANGSAVVVSRLPVAQFPPIKVGVARRAVRRSSNVHAGGSVAAMSAPSIPQEVKVDFHDFGEELFPGLDASAAESDTDGDNVKFEAGIVNNVPRKCCLPWWCALLWIPILAKRGLPLNLGLNCKHLCRTWVYAFKSYKRPIFIFWDLCI